MTRRAPVLLLIVAAIVAMLVLDRGDDTTVTTDDEPLAGEFGLPVAAPDDAVSSTWFCAGGTADEEAFADHTVIVANSTDTPVTGTITVYAGEVAPSVSAEEQLEDLEEGEEAETTETTADDEANGTEEDDEGTDQDQSELPAPSTESIEVPALGHIEVHLADIVEAPLASAVVELPGGAFAVEHRVESRHGSDTAPCASDAAAEWHFSWGATTADARELLVFFNPFPDFAVVDGSFTTDDGPREPARFDGLVVPPRSVVGVDLGDDVTIRTEIAASFRTRAGRVVVDRIQRFDGSEGVEGLTVRLGAPVPKDLWYFPDGLVAEGVREQYVVYNPTESTSEVSLEIIPDDFAETGLPEPFEISLAPGGVSTVDVGEDGRVADEVGHSAVVRTVDGSAVVVERVLTLTDPAARRGVSVTGGSPAAAPEWLFAAGGTSSEQDEWLYFTNPSNEFLASVSVTALANGQLLAIQDLQDVELAPASRLAVRLGELIEREDLPVIVSSTLPIVVERGLYAAEGPGVSNAIGIPLSEGVEPPEQAEDPDAG